mmetsp:Transcript_12467/g.30702  ORF Transcript_12467/g.30702 Transcript_12467/m.30702 type:complete len:139 (-) Transcript_12467:122-538(-)
MVAWIVLSDLHKCTISKMIIKKKYIHRKNIHFAKYFYLLISRRLILIRSNQNTENYKFKKLFRKFSHLSYTCIKTKSVSNNHILLPNNNMHLIQRRLQIIDACLSNVNKILLSCKSTIDDKTHNNYEIYAFLIKKLIR